MKIEKSACVSIISITLFLFLFNEMVWCAIYQLLKLAQSNPCHTQHRFIRHSEEEQYITLTAHK